MLGAPPPLDSLARVRALLDAARRAAADPGLVPQLVASTDLSPQGVALGLARYLETGASDAELGALVAGATPASRVHVILSANVFTAPLRALAVAVASSAHVTVRPSRRDPVFTRALVAAAPELGITLDETSDVGAVEEGEVHVYGRDETIASVRHAARPGVRVRAHGPGLGIALVTERADLTVAARALADDVVVFDQRGCLSPRVALVMGGTWRAGTFTALLHARLAEVEITVPRGRLDAGEARDALRYVETMAFAGEVARGAAHAVGLAQEPVALVVPPPGRHVHVARGGDVAEARRLLEPIARLVVAVGSDDLAEARAIVDDAARVRVSPLGEMQRPPLDGPVDRR